MDSSLASRLTALTWTLAIGLGVTLSAGSLSAQVIVGPSKTSKPASDVHEDALERMRDGRSVMAATTSEALVRSIHGAIKLIGLHRFDETGLRALKSAILEAERRVRAVAGSLPSGEIDAGARAELQGALDELVAVVDAGLARGDRRVLAAHR